LKRRHLACTTQEFAINLFGIESYFASALLATDYITFSGQNCLELSVACRIQSCYYFIFNN